MKRISHLRIFKKRGIYYLPAITLVMVALTLIVMHAISTFRTLDQNRRHWENFFEKNGKNIISMMKIEVQGEYFSSPLRLKERLEGLVQSLDVAYVGLMDQGGRWVTGGQGFQEYDFLPNKGRGEFPEGEGILFQRVKKLPDDREVFEFTEFILQGPLRAVVVGLWMAPLQEARRQDIRHAILMGVILLILGLAAFYFIFVVQNYYLVDRALAEMKSYTENVVESMASGLITVDTKGRIVSTNIKASSLLGIDTRQVRGEPLESVVPDKFIDIEEVIQHDRGIIEKEVDIPVGHGLLPSSLSVTPLKNSEGEKMGAVIVLRDLREIRELQERVRRSERLASLGRLASGVAHEIRNPLSSIKGFTQYFRDKFETGTEDRSYAEIVIQEVERLNRVINQLLDFAKPKELHLQMKPLSQILEHPLNLIRANLKERKIELVSPAYPDGEVNVDPDQITQAFLNIFLNALESMGNRGEFRLETFWRPEKNRIEIWISDTGPGIPKENIAKIFDPFFSTKKKGTGLGLAITATIIEAHGGEISVESKEGKGTTFKVSLPFFKT